MSKRNTYSIWLVLLFAIKGLVVYAEQEDSGDAKRSTKLAVNVFDGSERPIEGASVKVFLWEGVYEKVLHSATTGNDGVAKMEDLPDSYVGVFVSAQGYAINLQELQFSPGEEKTLNVRLSKATKSSVLVTTPEGQPLAGAEIARLEVLDPRNTKYIIWNSFLPNFGLAAARSDSVGQLMLPDLPEGSKVKILAVHPQWASNSEVEVLVQPGRIGSIALRNGSHLKMNLFDEEGEPLAMDERRVKVHVHSRENTAYGIIHDYQPEKNQVIVTVPEDHYEILNLSFDKGHIITPNYPSGLKKHDDLHFDQPVHELKFLVRKLYSLKGRVVSNDGSSIEAATVYAHTENLYPNDKNSIAKSPESCNVALTDATSVQKSGEFSVKVPKGKATISIQLNGFIYKSVDIDVTGDMNSPDIMINKIPTLSGMVTDENGKPVANALLHFDREDTYIATRENGSFDITPEQATDRRRDNGKPVTTKTLYVFDPNSNLATFQQFDLSENRIWSEMKITLRPQDGNWLKASNAYQKKSPEIQERIDQEIGKYPLAKVGAEVDDLSKGTWLNTPAKSLKDFQGKFVMLDFWFIGCGPCMAELPTVQLANKVFADANFALVSVHIAGQSPDNVQQFGNTREMHYPIVVDTVDEPILTAYQPFGVDGFPSYLLLGPDGKLLACKLTSMDGLQLRVNMLETLHIYLRCVER